VGADVEDVVLGSQVVGDFLGVLAFVVARIVETDRKRLHRPLLSSSARDDARIDAAGEKHAQRHVADELPRHRRDDELAHVRITRRRAFVGHLGMKVPTLMTHAIDRTVLRKARRKLLDALVELLRVPVAQVRDQPVLGRAPIDPV
jgi:hypothetical protein